MALEDGLRVIDADWENIESRLTVRELLVLASAANDPAAQKLDRASEVSRAEFVFYWIADALPASHPAWDASGVKKSTFGVSPARTSFHLLPRRGGLNVFDEGLAISLAQRCIGRAGEAVTSPSIFADVASDFLADAAARDIAAQCFGGAVPRHIREFAVLAAEFDGQLMYPIFQFQFAHNEVVGVHEIVGRLNRRLGGRSDPLGAISWWLTSNAWLGEAPSRLVGTGRDAEIDYAAEQLANDSW